MKNPLHGIANCNKQLKAPGCFTFILFFIHFFAGAQPGIWEMKRSLGDSSMARQSGVGFSIGNKGYFGTGNTISSDNSDIFKSDFWEYDPATNAWTQKANFGGGQRTTAMGFSIGNKGYLGTGATSPGPFAFDKDFWEYDPAANVWTRKADYGGLETVGAVGFSIGNKGYVGTGANSSGLTGDFWEYDPVTDAWTRKASFGGGPRYGAVGFSIGNKGYIGTGYDSNGHTLGNRKDFWEYEPATDTWTQKADFGGLARSLAAGFSIGSKGYIGTGDISPDRAGFSDDFWEYDPATNGWLIKAYFGGGERIHASGFNIGSKGYLGFGAFTDNPSAPRKNDLWEYTPGAESQIQTHVSTTTFCSGSSYVISYTTSGIFNAGNIFTAQLSNAAGSFTNPINIGSVSSTVSGTINATIPGIPGTNFHIRVISSSPPIIGSDDGTSYTIDPPPVVKSKNITVYLNAQGHVTITPQHVDDG
jgi:N-acetylneuraminic acid mutarotase